MKWFLAIACTLVFLAWAGTRIVAGIQYDTQLGGFISQATTSPSPTIAAAKLDVAIAEIERRGWTKGNTGILFTYPTNDVGFWYQRLVDSRSILKALPSNDSPLEVSNTMMRVHESLTGTDINPVVLFWPRRGFRYIRITSALLCGVGYPSSSPRSSGFGRLWIRISNGTS